MRKLYLCSQRVSIRLSVRHVIVCVLYPHC